MTTLPLTFLFTDLENSTPLWEQFPEEMQVASERHDALLREVIELYHGQVVKTTGDGFHAVFTSPYDGVSAALAAQQVIHKEPWPAAPGRLKVRIGLHTGESQEREGDYYGIEVNLAARVMGLAYGGQILLSETTTTLIQGKPPPDCSVADLGRHRLKGISAPRHIFQLCHPDLPAEFPALKSLGAFKHNLPRQLSSFIGRKKELSDVKNLIQGTNLLTLLGPGGTGKTRLMLQVAEDMIEDFPDGVWLVELAPLADPALIPERVAGALNVQDQPGRRLEDTLVDFIRHKEMLLLLDNVEHIVQASATFTEQLLENCPKLKILITGREALFIEGEMTLQIPSLSLPIENQSLAEIAASESVQFFLERALSVRPDMELTPQNAAPMAEVVRRLDGIPLALEMAAARLRMLTVEQIAQRLNDRFRLLTGGRRTALPRQQTLQALIDWSWNLLDESERVLLRRLSVFSGGWSLEAAQEVASYTPTDAYEVLDNLENLINKSLITVEHFDDGESRYGMLESIHQYARDKLFESQEGEMLRERHAEYYATFAEKAGVFLESPDLLEWVGRLRRELDNFRSVIVWATVVRPELALRLTKIMGRNLVLWISPREANKWLEGAISGTRAYFEKGNSPVLASDFIKALIGLGFTRQILEDHKGALDALREAISLSKRYDEKRLLAYATAMNTMINLVAITPELVSEGEEAIRISRQNDYPVELAWNLTTMGFAHLVSGDLQKADVFWEEAHQLSKKNGNPRSLAIVVESKAYKAMMEEDWPAARALLLQALEKYELLGAQTNINMTRSNLAHVLRKEGRLDEAETLYHETILAWQEQGNFPAVAHQLECLGFIAGRLSQHLRAATLVGAAQAIRANEKVNRLPDEQREFDQALAFLGTEMGELERNSAMSKGAEMSVDEAVRFAQQG